MASSLTYYLNRDLNKMKTHGSLVSGGKNFQERTVSAEKLGRTILENKEVCMEKPKEPDLKGWDGHTLCGL